CTGCVPVLAQQAKAVAGHVALATCFRKRLVVRTVRAFDNVEHTLCHTANRDRIAAGRNALQYCSLYIQRMRLLHYAYQQANLARRQGETDEQVLDMLKGLDREGANEDRLVGRDIDL